MDKEFSNSEAVRSTMGIGSSVSNLVMVVTATSTKRCMKECGVTTSDGARENTQQTRSGWLGHGKTIYLKVWWTFTTETKFNEFDSIEVALFSTSTKFQQHDPYYFLADVSLWYGMLCCEFFRFLHIRSFLKVCTSL